MEGSPIAPSVFLQQSIPGRFWDPASMARKRDLTWQNLDIMGRNPNQSWNPSVWDWDSVRFSAKPSETPHLGSQIVLEPAEDKVDEEEDQNLTLKLGGAAYSSEEPRPSKRVRPGSPGSYPACQVDDCRADLSQAKDYHKRHKVCEQHSKASKVIVGNQMQRFCQQCSRFHLLSEFDETKRSCRRRLAGHNRRRRKTQPDVMPTNILPTQGQTNFGNGNLDSGNFSTRMADTQCNNGEDKLNTGPSISDIDQLIQVSKIQSLPVTSSMLKLQEVLGFDLNSNQISKQALLEDLLKASGNLTSSSRKDLLGNVAADSCRDDKSRMICAEPVADGDLQSQPMQLPSAEVAAKTSAFHPNFESSKPQEINSSLSLQLHSFDKDNCITKSKSREKYFSSESSNQTTNTSPSCSPPVMQSFSQLNTEPQNSKHEIISITEDCNGASNGIASRMPNVPLNLFRDSNGQSQNGVVHDVPYLAGYSSSSRSDHSPCTSNSYAEVRTSQIIFKLFDKDPSNLPVNLRAEILSWLSSRPLEMESYIRPGCVVLSIYLSMLHKDWDELDKDFLGRVSSLIDHSKSGFWGSARFLVRVNGLIASHRDGKIRVWRASNAPELISVSPVAIVSGEETTLKVKGRNLTFPGTRIHYTCKGDYRSPGLVGSSSTGCISQSFSVHVGPPGFFGRCFIEVENGLNGNSFPVIIANSSICQELRDLEAEFEDDRQLKEAVHFLNELGWLFQRKNDSSSCFHTCFSNTHYRFLLLFSVDRDWLALTKTLLEILAENTSKGDVLMQDTVEMLSDVQLLSRAVKRKSRKMIDLLLHYTIQSSISGSKVYLFPPNTSGPGGMTPLHIIASMLNSEDIVDALISDPQEIGLSCWSSMKDDSGYSPLMYASMRNNHSYNSLVARKVARKLEDRRNRQISIAVDSENPQLRSCSQCAAVHSRHLMRMNHHHGLLKHAFLYPMLVIAAVCVCICLFYRGAPQIENSEIGLSIPFKWENLESGPR